MKFGILAEGKSDCAVLTNILHGLALIERNSDVRFLRPVFSLDATDIPDEANIADGFSNWTLVKKDCIAFSKIDNYLNHENFLGQERKIIIQIDTAECEETGYDVPRPNKKETTYCEDLRTKVINKIKSWVNKPAIEDQLFYAVCIEEMEAWVHALYENKNTVNFPDPKKAFEKYRSKKSQRDKKFQKQEKKLVNKSTFEKFTFYSKGFQKKKNITSSLKNNKSLEEFVNSLSALTA